MPATIKRRISQAQAHKIAKRFGPTCNADEIAELCVWSKPTIYKMFNDGTFPIQPIKVGNRWHVPTAPLLKLLGLEE